VLDEFYWLDKDDPNSSLQRATVNRGEDAHTDGLFTLSEQAQKEIVKLFLATRQEMENKRINEVFGEGIPGQQFLAVLAHDVRLRGVALGAGDETILHRFIHQIRGMPDFSTLKFTKYNQYESLVLPLVKWLLDHGVVFHYGTEVTDVDFDIAPGRKQATRIHWRRDGVEGGVDLGPDDLVFMTIGSLTENSDNGDHHTPAKLNARACAGMGSVAAHRRKGSGVRAPGRVRLAHPRDQMGVGHRHDAR
jgi:oleate hydratase